MIILNLRRLQLKNKIITIIWTSHFFLQTEKELNLEEVSFRAKTL